MFLLFTFAFEMAYASSVYSQTKVFTMQSAEKTVLQVFKEIEKNSEFIIFYRDGVIDLNRKVSVNVVNQSVDKYWSSYWHIPIMVSPLKTVK